MHSCLPYLISDEGESRVDGATDAVCRTIMIPIPREQQQHQLVKWMFVDPQRSYGGSVEEQEA